MLARTSSHTLRLRSFLLVASVILLAIATLLPLSLATMRPQTAPNATVAPPQGVDFGKLPLSFEANRGQTDPSVKFMAHASGGTMYFTPSEVVLSLPSPQEKAIERTGTPNEMSTAGPEFAKEVATAPSILRMQFLGANPDVRIEGTEQLPGKVNYFIGSDPSKWQTDLPTYSTTHYRNLYPGIDLKYEGTGEQLKGTYTVAPRLDPSLIQWRYTGVQSMHIDEVGNMQVMLSGDGGITVTEQAPIAWQEIGGVKVAVKVVYKLTPDNSVSFVPATYDRDYPLIIDPILEYSTYLGGTGGDTAYGITVDGAGNIYVAGYTNSANFPTSNAYQPIYRGAYDAFITKLNASGSALIYSTYLGGSLGEEGRGIAVDQSGNAYVAGHTSSTDFPLFNPCQQCQVNHGNTDAFVASLNASGSQLIYSTYLGGDNFDQGYDIAVDASRNAYITGVTNSSNFPTVNAYQTALGGNTDVFVTKLNPSGTTSTYSTYLGGSDNEVEYGYAIAVDGAGNAYITGETYSSSFPTRNPCALCQANHVPADAYVSRFNTNLSGNASLQFSTYVGGTGRDQGLDIAVDASSYAYVTGMTESVDFPRMNALQQIYQGGGDAFILKLNTSASTLAYSTYLGGSGQDVGKGIAVEETGSVYAIGSTASTDFPIVDPYQPIINGSLDVFVTKVNPTGSSLVYSTYLGGSGADYGASIAVDTAGSAYLTGFTGSSDFPLQNPFQPTYGGGTTDGFVAKIEPSGNPPTATSTRTATSTATPSVNSLTISNLNIQHMSYPDEAWTTVPVDGTTDGNIVKIEVTIHNSGGTEQNPNLWFHDFDTGVALPAGPFSRSNGASISVPAGGTITVEYKWNTDGFAWNDNRTPHTMRLVQASLRTPNNQVLVSAIRGVRVVPKPVILVHGWRGHPDNWNSYVGSSGFLQAENSDWRGYAVTGMNMGRDQCPLCPTNSISENADIMADYIEGVRNTQDAWHVDVVVHSMGGLVSRWFIQADMPNMPSSAGSGPVVSHLVMLGTPNRGSPCADAIVGSRVFWPATLELTRPYVDFIFNALVTNARNVPFSVLAGNPQQLTCLAPGPGDLVVQVSSAHAPFISDTGLTGSAHTQLTTSQYDFLNFVKPRLAIGRSLMESGEKRINPGATSYSHQQPVGGVAGPQILLATSLQLSAGATVEVPITVPVGTAFGVVFPGYDTVQSVLRNPSGTVVDQIDAGSERARQPVHSLQANNPMVGTWTLQVQNQGTGAITLPINALIDGNPLVLSFYSGEPNNQGLVEITAFFSNAGLPVSGANIIATLKEANTPEFSVTLVEGTTAGTYVGSTQFPGTGLYGVVINASFSGTQRMTTGVIDYSTVLQATATPTIVPVPCTLQFSDVPDTNTFYTFVRCLACRNILSGYADGTFRPNNLVTRGQLAKIVSNAAGFAESPDPQIFEDVSPSNTFYQWINRLARRGHMSGYACGGVGEPCTTGMPYFRPFANATRGQTSKIVSNAAGYSEIPTDQTFEDVPPTHTFYREIQRLASRNIMQGYPCGGLGEPCTTGKPYFRPQNNVTRGQSAKIVANTFYPGCVTP